MPWPVVIFKLLSRDDYLIKLTFTELSFVKETIPPTGIVSFKLNLCKLKFEPVEFNVWVVPNAGILNLLAFPVGFVNVRLSKLWLLLLEE